MSASTTGDGISMGGGGKYAMPAINASNANPSVPTLQGANSRPVTMPSAARNGVSSGNATGGLALGMGLHISLTGTAGASVIAGAGLNLCAHGTVNKECAEKQTPDPIEAGGINLTAILGGPVAGATAGVTTGVLVGAAGGVLHPGGGAGTAPTDTADPSEYDLGAGDLDMEGTAWHTFAEWGDDDFNANLIQHPDGLIHPAYNPHGSTWRTEVSSTDAASRRYFQYRYGRGTLQDTPSTDVSTATSTDTVTGVYIARNIATADNILSGMTDGALPYPTDGGSTTSTTTGTGGDASGGAGDEDDIPVVRYWVDEYTSLGTLGEHGLAGIFFPNSIPPTPLEEYHAPGAVGAPGTDAGVVAGAIPADEFEPLSVEIELSDEDLSGTNDLLTDTDIDTVVEPQTITGLDLEVNYVDFRDVSGAIIEVRDSAGVRANTGSVSLDTTVYAVPLEAQSVDPVERETGDATGIFTITSDDTFIVIEDLTDEDEGLGSTGFTLVETGVDGIFSADFALPPDWFQSDGSGAVPSTTGVDMAVNYVDFRDPSGEIIEVGDSAGVRANTGSVDTADLTIHVRVNDPDSDISASGSDVIVDPVERETGDATGIFTITSDPTLIVIEDLIEDLDEGLGSTGFTLVETGVDGIFSADFAIPPDWAQSDGSGAVPSTTGVDMAVNYVDFRDASGEIIEVGDSAGIRANTGSVSLDRTVYPVPWGGAI